MEKQANHGFAADTLNGLMATPKYLSSRYFYDAEGDRLFQQIMRSPEYYLTDCELEILSRQKDEIIGYCRNLLPDFDVVELGPGDCSKSIHLLRAWQHHQPRFTFYPIDISASIARQLQRTLPPQLPSVHLHSLTDTYLSALTHAAPLLKKRPLLVLFLGSSIGNMTLPESETFLRALKAQLKPGDLLLIGFDLKKHPQIILDAYNDQAGFTRAFNRNLLYRINRELGGTFDPEAFDHFPTYDPCSGLCKSYLVSPHQQSVQLAVTGSVHTICFQAGETILMERSQKYTTERIHALARQCGFRSLIHFTDTKDWFMDALWQVD